jgi:peroxiredoxin
MVPAVLVFLRGHWCPYCRLTAVALAGIEREIGSARLVAICPETAHYLKKLRKSSNATFPILTDLDNGYALSLGLSFGLDAEISDMLDAFSCHLPGFHGGASWLLPIPAIFVIGRDGKVSSRHVNADFRNRMAIDELLLAVRVASSRGG